MNIKRFLLFLVLFLSAQLQVWSALNPAQELDVAEIRSDIKKAGLALNQDKLDSASLLINKIGKVINATKNNKLTYDYLVLKCRWFGKQRKNHEALKIANQMLVLSVKLKSPSDIANSYSAMGFNQQQLGQLNLAVESIIKALKIAESTNNKLKQAEYNYALSNIFFELREPSKILIYSNKSNELVEQLNDTVLLKNRMNTVIAEILAGKYDLAIKHLQDSEVYFLKRNDYAKLVQLYLYYRHAYFGKKEYQTSLYYLNKSFAFLPKMEKKSQQEINLHLESAAAETYYWLGNYKQAQYYFNRNIGFAEKMMDAADVKSLYQLGAQIYEKIENPTVALSYLKKYKRLNDSVSNISMRDAIYETEIKYQTTIKEKAISEQKLQLIHKDFELQQKNKYIFYGLIAIIVLVLGASIIYLIYRNKNQSIELSLLKAQIHPHFLFNTLNNLYALTMGKSDESPNVVLGLSSILRYILYECNALKVDLTKEMAIIEDYISLEKIRYKQRLEVNLNVSGDLTHHKVVPLLILPLVENAFKHGVSKLTDDTWINIEAKIKSNKFLFKISNNKPEEDLNQSSPSKYGNIGLLNIQKRLNILYPKKHKLKITNADEVFIVALELTLN